jgi:hypothetical protein
MENDHDLSKTGSIFQDMVLDFLYPGSRDGVQEVASVVLA